MVKLEKKVSIKRARAKIIREMVFQAKTTTEIQNELKSKGLGIRRKTLLSEIRAIKGYRLTDKERKKHIPKKYRKKEKVTESFGGLEPEKLQTIHRMSLILRDLPLHSTTLARNYLGFRLTAFSLSESYLMEKKKELKQILIDETNKYTYKYYGLKDIFDSEYTNWSRKVNIEYPTEIITYKTNLNNTWVFVVEKEGHELESNYGVF